MTQLLESKSLSRRSPAVPIETSDVRVLAERTSPDGPDAEDHFLVFVLSAKEWLMVPFEEAREQHGSVLEDLLGSKRQFSLANSVQEQSVVLWPPELQGQPLFVYRRTEERSLWDRILGAYPEDILLAPAVLGFLGHLALSDS